jgi:hypothetical protein
MNKKLLCSTALAGALIVSGSALAELKVGGNVTHTTTFGKDDSSSTANGSGERLGTEMNVTLSSKQDLKNGMYMSYKANIEFDSAGTTTPDVEYEIQLGQGNFYIAAGSDAGNNISASPTLPSVGYHIGSLAQMISTSTPLNYDGLLNSGEVNNTSHLSLNYKVAGGTASVLWAPNVTEDDNDAANINAGYGASRIGYIYTGSPMPNLTVIVGRSVETGDSDTAANEKTNDKAGISYNFGQFQAGYEWQKYKTGSDSAKERADNYSLTFKASDAVTLGVQHSRAKNDATAGAYTEKLTAISAGYNLGPASIAVSLVDADNLGSTTTNGVDAQGVVITTKMGF